MQNKSQKVPGIQDVKSKLKRFVPTIKSGWHISFSIYQENILFIFQSTHTDQTIIRYFTNELEAVSFLNFIIMHDSRIEWPDL